MGWGYQNKYLNSMCSQVYGGACPWVVYLAATIHFSRQTAAGTFLICSHTFTLQVTLFLSSFWEHI